MPSLLLFPVLILFAAAAADAYPSPCSNATCGDLTIAYPFWLYSSSSHDCGYPSLGLACENNTTLILPIHSHRYKVLSIDYDNHAISLADADVYAAITTGCPRLDLNLSIDTNSGLQLTDSDSNITIFYNCKKNASWSSALELSGCPEQNTSSYVFMDDDGHPGEAYDYGCTEVVVAPVLKVHKKAIFGENESSPPGNRLGQMLSSGFELNYSPNSVPCGTCERSGGWCGYQQNQTHGGMGFTCFCDGGPTKDHCPTAVEEPNQEDYYPEEYPDTADLPADGYAEEGEPSEFDDSAIY